MSSTINPIPEDASRSKENGTSPKNANDEERKDAEFQCWYYNRIERAHKATLSGDKKEEIVYITMCEFYDAVMDGDLRRAWSHISTLSETMSARPKLPEDLPHLKNRTLAPDGVTPLIPADVANHYGRPELTGKPITIVMTKSKRVAYREDVHALKNDRGRKMASKKIGEPDRDTVLQCYKKVCENNVEKPISQPEKVDRTCEMLVKMGFRKVERPRIKKLCRRRNKLGRPPGAKSRLT